MSHRVLSLDPGTTRTGWCIIEDGVPTDWGWSENDLVRDLIQNPSDGWQELVIEDIGNYGTPMGRDTIETIKWMGRFDQAHFDHWKEHTTFIMRPTIKTHLCGVASAKDGNVRQALIDRFGGDEIAVGGKKCKTCAGKGWRGRDHDPCGDCHCDIGALNNNDNCGYLTHPGPLKGMANHAWSALAVGVVYIDQAKESK